jgi:mannose-6-phosphate isomerase-like protein (cupin superfamily)
MPAKADGVNWGEIWLASEEFGLVTKVSSGSQSGKTLAQIKTQWGPLLTGSQDHDELGLKKTLNSSFRLERTGEEPGPIRFLTSDEFWYVLEAGPDSWMGAGTSPAEGPIAKRLKKIPLEPGDRYLVPKGLIHCQGPSATVLKALPSASFVETIDDWGRPPDTWNFSKSPVPITSTNSNLPYLHTICSGRDRILYQGPLFTVTLVNTNFFSAAGEKMSLVCPVRGRGSIETSGINETVRLHPGQATLIPAGIPQYSIKSSTIISYLLFEFNQGEYLTA